MAYTNIQERHNFIINKISKSAITWQELNFALQNNDLEINQRTFQRDIIEIEINFGKVIKNNKKDNTYYLHEDLASEAQNKFLDDIRLFEAINKTKGLDKFIHLSTRKAIGTEWLPTILDAIKKRKKIQFTHYNYWNDEMKIRIVSPLALKEFNNRWYVIVLNEVGNILTYGLDRISELKIIAIKYEYPKDFSAEEMYSNCFGIIGPPQNNLKPELVVISTSALKGRYFKSMPIHHSQKIIKENKIHFEFSLQLYITHDFIMELLSHGADIKILKPVSLIKLMKREIVEMGKVYSI